MAETYRILDEPRASAVSHLAVRPMWPLFSLMFAGSWLALPWFAFNAFATGSATRTRELVLAGVSVAGTFALVIGSGFAFVALGSHRESVPYFLLAITVWKLGLAYAIFIHQERSNALREYFGGRVRTGLPIVLAGAFFGRELVLGLFKGLGLWVVLVS